jgi:hypothetical protein
MGPEDTFSYGGNLAAVMEAKDVEKTRNLGLRLAAISDAGLVQKDCR